MIDFYFILLGNRWAALNSRPADHHHATEARRAMHSCQHSHLRQHWRPTGAHLLIVCSLQRFFMLVPCQCELLGVLVLIVQRFHVKQIKSSLKTRRSLSNPYKVQSWKLVDRQVTICRLKNKIYNVAQFRQYKELKIYFGSWYIYYCRIFEGYDRWKRGNLF